MTTRPAWIASQTHKSPRFRFIGRAVDELGQHGADPLDGLVAFRLLVGVPPVLSLPNIGVLDASALASVQLDDAGPHVRAADVDRENGVVASQDPAGR